MKPQHEYLDGTVDIRNKAIIDENGVNTDSPYLDYTAEKLGGIVIDTFVAFGSAMYPAFSENKEGRLKKVGRLDTQPRTKRFWGKTILAAGLTLGIVSQTENIQNVFTDTVRTAYEFMSNEPQ